MQRPAGSERPPCRSPKRSVPDRSSAPSVRRTRWPTRSGSGYDEVVLRDGFAERVLELTDGRRVDLVLDSVGGQARADSLGVLAVFGRLAAFDDAGSHPDLTLAVRPLWKRNQLVGGFNIGNLARRTPELVSRFARTALELVVTGQVRIDITDVLPLSHAGIALDRLAAGTSRGKLVLTV